MNNNKIKMAAKAVPSTGAWRGEEKVRNGHKSYSEEAEPGQTPKKKCVFYIEACYKRVLVGFCILKNMCLSMQTDTHLPPHPQHNLIYIDHELSTIAISAHKASPSPPRMVAG